MNWKLAPQIHNYNLYSITHPYICHMRPESMSQVSSFKHLASKGLQALTRTIPLPFRLKTRLAQSILHQKKIWNSCQTLKKIMESIQARNSTHFSQINYFCLISVVYGCSMSSGPCVSEPVSVCICVCVSQGNKYELKIILHSNHLCSHSWCLSTGTIRFL
jgi:hypothetical protein